VKFFPVLLGPYDGAVRDGLISPQPKLQDPGYVCPFTSGLSLVLINRPRRDGGL